LRSRVDFLSEPVTVGDGLLAMGRDLYGNMLEFWQLGTNDPQPFTPAVLPFAN